MDEDNLARNLARLEAALEVAEVIGHRDGSWQLRGQGDYRAERATSCLLEPAVGDHVLVALHEVPLGEGAGHIVAVLSRRDAGAAARLSTPGDLDVCAPNGQVRISAREAVELVTPGEAGITSGRLRVSSRDALVAITAASFVGERVVARLDQLKTVARTVEQNAGRWVQRLGRAFRFIEGAEHTEAGTATLRAREAICVEAKATVIKGQQLAKVDGDQVHLG